MNETFVSELCSTQHISISTDDVCTVGLPATTHVLVSRPKIYGTEYIEVGFGFLLVFAFAREVAYFQLGVILLSLVLSGSAAHEVVSPLLPAKIICEFPFRA